MNQIFSVLLTIFTLSSQLIAAPIVNEVNLAIRGGTAPMYRNTFCPAGYWVNIPVYSQFTEGRPCLMCDPGKYQPNTHSTATTCLTCNSPHCNPVNGGKTSR